MNSREIKADTKPSEKDMMDIIRKAITDYRGDSSILESAIGALVWGRHIGWHGLRLMHSGRTFKRYEDALGIKFKDVLPTRTDKSRRLNGIRYLDKISETVGKFWQVVTARMVSAKEAALVEAATE